MRPEFKWFLEAYYQVQCTVVTTPEELAERIRDSDVFIFGDYHRKRFDEEPGCLEKLLDGVQDGVSLLYYGGWESYGAGGYVHSPLARVLPVEMQEDDVRYLPHGILGIRIAAETRYLTQELDFKRFPLSTTYNLVRGPKEGAIVVLDSGPRDLGTVASENVPLAIYKDYGRYRILCITMNLIGGGAKDLSIWEQYPLFLKLCLQELSGYEIGTVHYEAGTNPFREFLKMFRETGEHRERDWLLRENLASLWFEDFKVYQYRYIGDLAGLVRSEYAAISRVLMLPHLLRDPLAYGECEPEMYKYAARTAGNRLQFGESGTLYAMAGIRQKNLEEMKGSGILVWSYYYKGMNKLCEAMDLMARSPLDTSAVLRACEESLRNFGRYVGDLANDVPEHKRQVRCLVEFIRTLLFFRQFRRSVLQHLIRYISLLWHKNSSNLDILRQERILALINSLARFSETYDECPAWADKRFIAPLLEALKVLIHFDKRRIETLRSSVAALEAEYAGEQYWKVLFLHSIMYVLDDAMTQSTWRRLLEEARPWLEATALFTFVAAGLLSSTAVQDWFKYSAAAQLRTVSSCTAIVTGVLAVISILVRHFRIDRHAR